MDAEQVWLILYLLVLAVMAMLAAFSYFAWRNVGELPMQFGTDGQPTWYARTAIGVAFMPSLALVVTNLQMVWWNLRLPYHVKLILCLAFFVVQVIHLVMAKSWLDRQIS